MTAAAMVAATGMTACSSSTSTTPAAAASKTFTYWSMWKDNEPQAKVIQEALAKYKAETGVTVTVEWHGRTVLDDVAAAIKAGKPVPDLSDGSINTILGAAANGVPVADLTPVYQQPVPGRTRTWATSCRTSTSRCSATAPARS
ncbi:hypothetical protein ACFQ9X_05405 [Catenulispora yoronensis]